jgi:hypothetical protein
MHIPANEDNVDNYCQAKFIRNITQQCNDLPSLPVPAIANLTMHST